MRSKKKSESFLKKIFLSTHGFPIFICLAMLTVALVVFRMKSLDYDYKTNEVNISIDRVLVENKELHAKKARLLSTRNLRDLAQKYNLKEPTQKQIIVVP